MPSQDPAQAEALLGSSLVRNSYPLSPDAGSEDAPSSPFSSFASRSTHAHSTLDDTPMHGAGALTHVPAAAPNVGTPIRLAPSVSAFRKPGMGGTPRSGPPSAPKAPQAMNIPSGVQASPSKSVLGQVSDMIFGW